MRGHAFEPMPGQTCQRPLAGQVRVPSFEGDSAGLAIAANRRR